MLRRLTRWRPLASRGMHAKQQDSHLLGKARHDVEQRICPRAEDYSKWYLDVLAAADMVDLATPVKGCAIIKPTGFAIWEQIQKTLDAELKASGHSNAYFPALIPSSFLSREAQHVEGFAKECAVVTHHRLAQDKEGGGLIPDPGAVLTEPYVLRPTSETIIWDAYRRWVRSHRDLPLLLNQWCNVFRWELRTRPFLRTSEFLWQEGHTAHASAAEAEAEAQAIIHTYRDLCENTLAVPVCVGTKSAGERFAGAVETLTVEAMMQNGWALQSGTSHYLGQNFARAFDVTFTDSAGEVTHVWATSWGVSTRLIGALVMTHSDDTGLALPPAVAPTQVVIVVIGEGPAGEAARRVAAGLTHTGLRVKVDANTGDRPGKRYYDWERKGVPLRLEIGSKDVANGVVVAKARVGDAGRVVLKDDEGLAGAVKALLDATQTLMLTRARQRMTQRTVWVTRYEEMRAALGCGNVLEGPAFFLAPWAADDVTEAAVKTECKATLRCYPTHEQHRLTPGAVCFYSGRPATHIALFARAF